MDILKQGLEIAKNYASTIGLPFEYSFKETTKQFTSFSFTNQAVGNAVAIHGEEILDEVVGDFKISCLIFDWDKISPRPTNPIQQPILKNGCNPIQIPEQWYNVYPEVLADYFLHEICHSGFFFSNNVAGDITHNQQAYPQWQQKQPHEYYLSLLSTMKNVFGISTPTPEYYPTLRFKSPQKEYVKALQTLLNEKGSSLIVDGDFGNKTLQAVIAFQKLRGLIADGIVGPKTWLELKKKSQ